MIRIQLLQPEADRLDQTFRQATDRKLRDRLQIVLMAHRGRPHQQIAADLLESPARARQKTGKSKVRRLQEAFPAHLRHVARTYPAERHARVVLIIDDAPWHRGQPIDGVLAEHPHLEFYRLPSYSPSLNVIERSGRCCGGRCGRACASSSRPSEGESGASSPGATSGPRNRTVSAVI